MLAQMIKHLPVTNTPYSAAQVLGVITLTTLIEGRLFSATNDKDTKSTDIQQTLDKAA